MAKTIPVSLYGGEIEIIFYPDSHQYKMKRANGKLENLVSVTRATGILSKGDALLGWVAKVARIALTNHLNTGEAFTEELIAKYCNKWREDREEASEIGTIVHKFAETFVRDPKSEPVFPEDDRAMNGVMAFLSWVNDNNVRFVNCERMVYSKLYDYVGTLDAEAYVNGSALPFLIDYKTSSGIYTNQFYQTAGYQLAAEEEGSKYAGRIILRFDKETGLLETKMLSNDYYKRDVQGFLGLMATLRSEMAWEKDMKEEEKAKKQAEKVEA